VLTDDAGLGNPSTFGGPIRTPTLTRLAAGGVKYDRCHTTALCSPTRAALLTGRNHHAVGFGMVGEFAGPFPGDTAMLPKDCQPFPKTLQGNGYSTACFGKWHLKPDNQQGPAGPFDRWPNALGCDYFEIPEGGAEGVIVAAADHLGGFALFVADGKLKHTYSFAGVREFKQESDTRLPTGNVNVRMQFAADDGRPAAGGDVTLFVNDEPVGRAHGLHGARALLRVRGHGPRPRQRHAGRSQLRREVTVRVHRNRPEGRLRRQPKPHRGARSRIGRARLLGTRRTRSPRRKERT
jgi:arylsulfatase A-like enzyme